MIEIIGQAIGIVFCILWIGFVVYCYIKAAISLFRGVVTALRGAGRAISRVFDLLEKVLTFGFWVMFFGGIFLSAPWAAIAMLGAWESGKGGK